MGFQKGAIKNTISIYDWGISGAAANFWLIFKIKQFRTANHNNEKVHTRKPKVQNVVNFICFTYF